MLFVVEKAALRQELEEEYKEAMLENARSMTAMRKSFEEKLKESKKADNGVSNCLVVCFNDRAITFVTPMRVCVATRARVCIDVCRPAKSHGISVSLQKWCTISRCHGNVTKSHGM